MVKTIIDDPTYLLEPFITSTNFKKQTVSAAAPHSPGPKAPHYPPGRLADYIYKELKRRAVSFEFRPGHRLNEVALAREFGVSRTPLRQALNRLRADELFAFSTKEGFCRKRLDVKEMWDLYELRLQIEMEAVKLSVERGSDDAIAEIDHFLGQSAGEVSEESTTDVLVALDEVFHERIMALADNAEILRTLRDINSRIQYVRIALEARRRMKCEKHHAIVQALRERNSGKCAELLYADIAHTHDEIFEAVKDCYARIYVPS